MPIESVCARVRLEPEYIRVGFPVQVLLDSADTPRPPGNWADVFHTLHHRVVAARSASRVGPIGGTVESGRAHRCRHVLLFVAGERTAALAERAVIAGLLSRTRLAVVKGRALGGCQAGTNAECGRNPEPRDFHFRCDGLRAGGGFF